MSENLSARRELRIEDQVARAREEKRRHDLYASGAPRGRKGPSVEGVRGKTKRRLRKFSYPDSESRAA